jgi:hypothetical protein
MSSFDPINGIPFPARQSTHRGDWVAMYLEPMPGSGERICIGVVAADTSRICARATQSLERLQWAYGAGANAISHAANIVMLEAKSIAEDQGLDRLRTALVGVEGLTVGERRRGAGRDLDDLAFLALCQSSAMAATTAEAPSETRPGERPSPIAKVVRRVVIAVRPALAQNFGRSFSLSASARATVYGFVGQNVVANFAALGGGTADAVAGQVDRAKARLWDLEQLQEGILRDVLGAPLKSRQFELLSCPQIQNADRIQASRRPASPSLLSEAVDTLEREADRFHIRWRYLGNPTEIARSLLLREAA